MTTPEVTKRIQFDRVTKDFNVYVTVEGCEEQYIGSEPTYGQAEVAANQYAIDFYTDNHTPEKAAELVMANCLSRHVAAATYPAFARFCAGLERGGDALDLGAQLADELAAHIA